ncbi:hypothetical protein GUITHDRAFT_122393 [Guillardia theta CCMP2712]|uniref:Uncharacterized protein n=1 Tax=Guillardia theta (strain CCMP2712) TaxID=905079 RepID=L1I698_GUITC|nr:hypothetical protein GUITHDRAFT_122393 [Guillardia theta CCMP2712]EKX31404.1 hypothetical protein GUITHDRAFT_122393 [Guillardia theta CCMP2712]|eukprot:XP_005818384.1 hypothetical protein GUITHDRAFT_122393 [Guillardia theta CCMP2712]
MASGWVGRETDMQQPTQKSHPMAIELSPYQSVMIHGWMRPCSVLTWKHVMASEQLTWPFLRSIGLSPERLKALQPDPAEWVKHGDVQLSMLPDMLCFPVHPILHLRADISEIWQMQLPSQLLEAMGVTYQQLVDIGMTKQIMARWSFSLNRWRSLGFREGDLQGWTDRDCVQVFHLSLQQTQAELRKPVLK